MASHQNLVREIKAEERRRLEANQEWRWPAELRQKTKAARAHAASIATKALRHVGFRARKGADLLAVFEPIKGRHPSLDAALRDERRETNKRKAARRVASETASSLRSELYLLIGKPIPARLAERIRRYLRGK